MKIIVIKCSNIIVSHYQCFTL